MLTTALPAPQNFPCKSCIDLEQKSKQYCPPNDQFSCPSKVPEACQHVMQPIWILS